MNRSETPMRTMLRTITRRLLLFALVLAVALPAFGASDASAASTPYTYYKTKLTSRQKKAYNALAKKVAAGKKKVTVYGDDYEFDTVPVVLSFDHPEYFWIGNESSFLWTFDDEGNSIVQIQVKEPWKNAYKQKAAFNKKVNKIVKKLKKQAKGKSTCQKARLIRDYICKNCSYVNSKYDQTAYGVFMKKKAVCAGYARAYKLLCDKMGIKCICVEGELRGIGHMLNYVKIGKKWYCVDCTNEDNPNGKPYNLFFLTGKTPAGFVKTYSHEIRKLPKLSGRSISPSKYL